jgi:Predicted transcriptional regulators
MLINELSKKTGVTIHTIRYYENLGLITGTTDESVKTNKYKNYDDTHVERLEIIKEAQEAGLTLAEIKVMMEKWYSGNFGAEEQVEFFESKIEVIENKIAQLQQMKSRLLDVKEAILKGECE